MTKVFNYRKFYLEINRQRKMRGHISWNKVATRAGIAPSNLHVFVKQFEDADRSGIFKALNVENVVKLLDWMKQTDLAPFIVDEDDPDVLDV